ncbi:PWI domain-containing protein [Coemansia reversa NRRL 1564]|uniref:PWI domain-containing protein n=1 Tax=Coemansia reversa (strain ATCC 12441 / NRRL 1564) TaxID=763665 RepID=A0A2G5BH57_COERN|nr:PWI domain-containing protein [Coemansia reversa NRRL 1564]|eukprot:PIA18321.1 PWI domain-containing protein [Coemansia reversa NRRL 1564]
MSGGFFRGTNVEQDQRFGDASKNLLKETSFSSVLKKPVEMSKVNMDAIKPWITNRINELIGIDDDVLQEYVINMLEETERPDARIIQVNLTGFLEDKTQEFMQSLWSVLLEAQKSKGGVPESFIQNKIEELKKRRDEQDQATANISISKGRLQEQTARRRTRSGRRSRWDSPAVPVVDDTDSHGLSKGRHVKAAKVTSIDQPERDDTGSRKHPSRHPRQHGHRSRSPPRHYRRTSTSPPPRRS